jgi:hypothetical protein
MRFSSEATDKGWTLVGEGKKRKIKGGRLISSVNRAKAFPFPSQGIKTLIKKQSQLATAKGASTPPLNLELGIYNEEAGALQASYTLNIDPIEDCLPSSAEC